MARRKYTGPVAEGKWAFPEGELSLEDAVTEAKRVIRADYYQDVAGIAQNVADAFEKGRFKTRDEFDQYLNESVKESQRVLYPGQAMLGLLASDNDDAAFDEGLEVDCSEGIDYSILMEHAMVADVIESLASNFDIDIDDDELFDEDDEDDDEPSGNPPTAKDLREFREFLRNATDRQLQGIYDKEYAAGRDEYVVLTEAEAERRSVQLEAAD